MKKIFGLLMGIVLTASIAIPVQAAEDERSVKEYLESILETVENTGVLSSDMEDAIHNYMDNNDVIPDDIEKKQVKEVVDYIKKKLETTDLGNEEEVKDAITEAEEQFQVTLSDADKQKILNIIEKINKLGLDSETILAQIDKLYEKYASEITTKVQDTYEEHGSEIVKQAQETVKENVSKSIGDYFSEMATRVKDFFKGFFTR